MTKNRTESDLTTQDSAAWLEAIRNQLDASARDLDGATLSRLNQARQRALGEATRARAPRWTWMALASAASLALAVFLLPGLRTGAPVTPIPVAAGAVEDFDLLTSEDQLALYSDLEFYAWLESQDLDG